MTRCLRLLAFASAALASQHVFSVHDDILAFPQYEIIFSDTFISDTDADLTLSSQSASPPKSHSSQATPQEPSNTPHGAELSHRPPTSSPDAAASDHDRNALPQIFEPMLLNGQRYLCAIPTVSLAQLNESAEAVARAEEEKELARATSRGWELLQDMDGQCMFYISGWWSYQFCYNGKIKQFHQLPPQKGVPLYPPVEDPTTPSYILGQAIAAEGENPSGEVARGKVGPESTELQAKGEMRYLVQKLGAGTTCDLTGKPRRIEVQFHCHPQSSDRIGWIKEVTTCSYLMVIYTPRLCDDVAFLPPGESKTNQVACREVLKEEEVKEWKRRKAAKLIQGVDEEREQRETKPVVGGVRVGGQKEMKESVDAKDEQVEVIARGRDGRVERVSEEVLKRLGLGGGKVDEWIEEIGERGVEWRLEWVNGEVRGVVL